MEGPETTLDVPAPEEEEIPQARTPEEQIEFRFKQTKASRLAEYITGLRPDDPKMAERLGRDQEIIRSKYRLPSRDMRFDAPTEYESFLRERIKKLGVPIRDKTECGRLFVEYSAGGVYFEDKKVIGLRIDMENARSYVSSLGILEHEYIHAEQGRHYPGMPIELMEYEAYVAGLNTKEILEYPDDIEFVIFGMMVGGSVSYWYHFENGKRSADDPVLVPGWDSPEYFLINVDKVEPELITTYKSRTKVV